MLPYQKCYRSPVANAEKHPQDSTEQTLARHRNDAYIQEKSTFCGGQQTDESRGRCWGNGLKISHSLVLPRTSSYRPCVCFRHSPMLVCLPCKDPFRRDHVRASLLLRLAERPGVTQTRNSFGKASCQACLISDTISSPNEVGADNSLAGHVGNLARGWLSGRCSTNVCAVRCSFVSIDDRPLRWALLCARVRPGCRSSPSPGPDRWLRSWRVTRCGDGGSDDGGSRCGSGGGLDDDSCYCCCCSDGGADPGSGG